MKTELADSVLLWRALASYIEECEKLAAACNEEEIAKYYMNEMEKSKNLRCKLKSSLSNSN